MNIIGFIIINFSVLYVGFKENISSLMLKTIFLTVFMMCGEIVFSLIVNLKLVDYKIAQYNTVENILLLFVGKSIYFAAVIILKNLSHNRKRLNQVREIIYLLLLPLSTCVFFIIFNNIRGTLDSKMDFLFIVLGAMLLLTNFVVYLLYDKMVENSMKIRYLQQVQSKEELDYSNYKIMKANYDDMRVMVHDFNKYCSNIEALITTDSTEVSEFLQKIKDKNKELLLIEYTNNKALNVLLSQKMQECNREKFDFQIYVQDTDLSFINEIDTVSIFANLIDNAIESCRCSTKKKIFLSVYTMNNAFIVIRIDNSADNEPVVINGKLDTLKHNKKEHGIGMISIRKAIDKYGGSLDWSYDSDNRSFNSTILIPIPKNDAAN